MCIYSEIQLIHAQISHLNVDESYINYYHYYIASLCVHQRDKMSEIQLAHSRANKSFKCGRVIHQLIHYYYDITSLCEYQRDEMSYTRLARSCANKSLECG